MSTTGEPGFRLRVAQDEDYRFTVEFDQEGVEPLVTDEPPPVGGGEGPNPTRLLGAAVGTCLASSLLYCLRRAKVEPSGLSVIVEGDVGRNAAGRLRVQEIRVRLEGDLPPDSERGLDRCIEVFEDYCTVTGSVRAGIDVLVDVDVRSPGEAVATGA
ncbi:MAG TPA: OsmC family protein [Longimicrobiales bacterium]|nr:OsmC family protein [Longimicrobiales bacterium]